MARCASEFLDLQWASLFRHHLRLTQHRQVYAQNEMLFEQTCIHVPDNFTVRHSLYSSVSDLNRLTEL